MTALNNYRPCVGITLINSSGLILICKRIDGHKNNWPHAWQMPQGGIDEGENPTTAATRELLEETGIHSVEIIREHPEWLTYDLPEAIQKKFISQEFAKGQKQKWFLMQFQGQESEINLAKPNAEFCEFAWVNKNEVLAKVVPFKKNVYKQVIQEFGKWLA